MYDFASRMSPAPTVILFFAVFLPAYTEACSTTDFLRESDSRYTFVGHVTSFAVDETDRNQAFGFIIEPVVVHQSPEDVDRQSFRIFPQMLSSTCEPYSLRSKDKLTETLSVGQLVLITAQPASSGVPGDLLVWWKRGSMPVPVDCSLDDVLSRSQGCGSSSYFNANADIARLRSLSATERYNVLSDLAEYRNYILFQELLDKYVEDPSRHEELLRKRYSDVIDGKCVTSRDEQRVTNHLDQCRIRSLDYAFGKRLASRNSSQ